MDIFKTLKRMPLFSKFMLNRYAPLRGAQIKITVFNPNEGHIRVKMPLNSSNKNIVGVHFGGSLYAMVDPFFMLIMMQQLGRDYIVWDKAAQIDFVKPGRDTVYADFYISQDEILNVKQLAANHAPLLRTYPVNIVDSTGQVIAKVEKTLYIRLKQADQS